MKGAELHITIADGGATEIAVKGVAGPSCSDLTKAIEGALGTVTKDEKTSDYHATSKQGQRATAGGSR